jgi:yersiniabactin synthetase, thiazolinyl reductase component
MRILLCGTNYGSAYLRVLQPAGILARSEQSRALATRLGVPFYRSVDEVRDIDAAVVAISGDTGREITNALLGRGVHVLAEHPQGTDDVLAHRRHRAVYHVNAHYSDIDASAAFVSTFRSIRSRLLFVNVLTNPRALYSAIELLGRAFGPWQDVRLDVLPRTPDAFFTIARTGVLTIQTQNVFSAVDDGSANWVSHNITAGFEDGVLTLAEAQGPLTWMPAPPSVAHVSEAWNRPMWHVLAAPPAAYGEHVTTGRDRANSIALARFAEEVRTGVTPPEQTTEHLVGVSRVWEQLVLPVPG